MYSYRGLCFGSYYRMLLCYCVVRKCLRMIQNNYTIIKCETSVGKEERDVAASIVASFRREKRIRSIVRVITSCLAALYLFLAACLSISEGMTTLTVTLLIGGVFLLFAAVVVKPFQKAMIKRRMKNFPKAKEAGDNYLEIDKNDYCFSEEGIEIKNICGEARWNWNAVADYGSMKHYIYLVLINREVLIIDKNTMSDDEIGLLSDLIQNMGENK